MAVRGGGVCVQVWGDLLVLAANVKELHLHQVKPSRCGTLQNPRQTQRPAQADSPIRGGTV